MISKKRILNTLKENIELCADEMILSEIVKFQRYIRNYFEREITDEDIIYSISIFSSVSQITGEQNTMQEIVKNLKKNMLDYIKELKKELKQND